MKKILHIINVFLIFVASFSLAAQVHIDTVIVPIVGPPQDTAYFECLAYIGEFSNPTITQYCQAVDDPNLLKPTFSVDPNQDIEFAFIVTIDSLAEVSQWDEDIKLLSADGIVDFAAEGLAPATYCFTAISYSQTEMDYISNNPTVQVLLSSGCMTGGETLAEIVACVKENFSLSTIGGAVDSILSQIIPTIVPEFKSDWSAVDGSDFNAPPCFDLTPEGAEYCIEVLGTPDCIVDIKEFFNNDFFETSNNPNPFKNVTTISYYAKEGGEVTFKVYDLLGNLIINEVKTANVGSNEFKFIAKDLQNGMYFYTVGNDEFAAPSRMVINR